MKSLIKIFEKKIFLFDELLGFWGNDDGSGCGLSAVWGYGLEFRRGGKGISHYWHESEDINEKIDFEWVRMEKSRIKIWFKSEIFCHEIEYIINKHIGAYGIQYLKLFTKGKAGFWNSPTPLYKTSKWNT